jgi:hypothetical protein
LIFGKLGNCGEKSKLQIKNILHQTYTTLKGDDKSLIINPTETIAVSIKQNGSGTWISDDALHG